MTTLLKILILGMGDFSQNPVFENTCATIKDSYSPYCIKNDKPKSPSLSFVFDVKNQISRLFHLNMTQKHSWSMFRDPAMNVCSLSRPLFCGLCHPQAFCSSHSCLLPLPTAWISQPVSDTEMLLMRQRPPQCRKVGLQCHGRILGVWRSF